MGVLGGGFGAQGWGPELAGLVAGLGGSGFRTVAGVGGLGAGMVAASSFRVLPRASPCPRRAGPAANGSYSYINSSLVPSTALSSTVLSVRADTL